MPILFLPYVVASFMGATRTDIGGSINVKYTVRDKSRPPVNCRFRVPGSRLFRCWS